MKILGCEDKEEGEEDVKVEVVEFLINVLVVFGGKENIIYLDVCIMCLCVLVDDVGNVDKNCLKKFGVVGVFEVGNNI